jgi:hypothetical protein
VVPLVFKTSLGAVKVPGGFDSLPSPPPDTDVVRLGLSAGLVELRNLEIRELFLETGLVVETSAVEYERVIVHASEYGHWKMPERPSNSRERGADSLANRSNLQSGAREQPCRERAAADLALTGGYGDRGHRSNRRCHNGSHARGNVVNHLHRTRQIDQHRQALRQTIGVLV